MPIGAAAQATNRERTDQISNPNFETFENECKGVRRPNTTSRHHRGRRKHPVGGCRSPVHWDP